ncbi:60S ribosomal protein L31-like [Pteronotus mesoamericanus]|uniref:60S ribosomal protein L31-like n=1 Tax=Pteronotus mesoamericanus TaxID=1884717 RepID=UPI0023EC8953|nr:60S ribosomal protein L31-like [Pteronotus parnellii mesoamericanus]
MAPTKKGGKKKKKGLSVINKIVTKEYTINIHKRIHGVGSKKHASQVLKEVWKFAMKEMGTPDVRTDTRLSTTVWDKGIRNVPHRNQVWLSRKRNMDEESPNKLYILVTYGPVTTFKKLQTANVDENSLLTVQLRFVKDEKFAKMSQAVVGMANSLNLDMTEDDIQVLLGWLLRN